MVITCLPTHQSVQNEDNQVLRGESRSVTVRNRLLGRGSYVAVFDHTGDQLLVSQRSDTKACCC